MKTVDMVPSAPKPGVMLGTELIRLGEAAEARRTLPPPARGAFTSPEQPEAEALLKKTE